MNKYGHIYSVVGSTMTFMFPLNLYDKRQFLEL